MSKGSRNELQLAARYEPQATKSFSVQQFFKNAGEVQGEQPTFAEQIGFCSLFFLLQLHSLKLSHSNKIES